MNGTIIDDWKYLINCVKSNEIQQETIPALLRTSLGRAGGLLSSQVMISTMMILIKIEMKNHLELKPYNLTIIILPITPSP